MSYMRKEMSRAREEVERDLEHVEEVIEMVNGRKKVHNNLDNAHIDDLPKVLELPLSMDSINHCDKVDEHFHSIDFFNCQAHPPLTFESKMS